MRFKAVVSPSNCAFNGIELRKSKNPIHPMIILNLPGMAMKISDINLLNSI